MFDKTQYVIEEPTTKALRNTYTIKDANGTLLGYSKKQELGEEISFLGRKIGRRPNFCFEGTDGARLGEVRTYKKRCEVYDAQNRLRATLRPSGWIWQKWRIEDAEGRQLAEAKEVITLTGKWQILRDGEVIVQIQCVSSFTKRLNGEWVYHVDILHQDFDPLLILSYAVLIVDGEKIRRESPHP